MSALRSLSLGGDASRTRARTPSPSREHKHRDFKRSHSQGSSPVPGRFQVNFARAQTANTVSNVLKYPVYTSRSPFLARAARYSEGNNSLNVGSSPNPSPEPNRRQKSKNFIKKNSLFNRLRSGSWHASSGSDSVKKTQEIRRVSEGSRRLAPGGLGQGSPASGSPALGRLTTHKENDVTYEENELGGLIHHILESHLCNVEFDHTKASELCGLLSKVLEKSVKSRLSENGKNFKISAIVYMAEVKDDGMKMATQCAWEPNQDHFAMATYETDTLFVVAMVFAVLFNDQCFI